MKTTMRMSAVGLLVCAFVLSSAVALLAWGGGYPNNPNGGPGPGGCPTGRNSGHNNGGPCGKGGKPSDEINTYTGELTITDTPVYYEAVGDGFPFVLNWNVQSSQTGPMGSRWTNSYNVYVVDDGATGARVFEGNGWEHGFALVSGVYVAQAGVFDVLVKRDPFTGWTLTRPDNTVLTFNTSGQLTKYTNSDGLYWTLAYSGGNLSTVTDPLSRVTQLTYTSGKLTRVTVPGGLHADFGYDANGRLSTITDALSTSDGQYTFAYSGTDTKIAGLTDPSGRQVRYYYGTFNNKTVVDHTDINGLSGSTVYYDFYLPGQGSNPAGSGQLYTEITETKDGVNRITRHIHENTDDPATGHYFGTLLSTVVDAGGLNLTQAWTYDSQLRMVTHRDSYQNETGGKDHIHRYYYTDANNPDKVTKYIDPENYVAAQGSGSPGYAYQYDGRGNKTKETTPEGRVTDYTYYSGTDRLYQVIIRDQDLSGNPVARTTSYVYYSGSDPLYCRYKLYSVTDAAGNATYYYYDTNGYLDCTIQSGDPNGYVTEYTANAVGDIVAVTDPNLHTTSYEYDGIHRQTRITYPSVGAGQKSRVTSWTCCGIYSVTDENGVVTKYEYNAYTHNLWKVHEDYYGLNYVTEYAYDEVGNFKTEKNARGYTTTYYYDDADRKIQADYPDSTHEYWTYRDDGRVYQYTDGRGRIVTYRYDADDRLATVGTRLAIAYQNDTDVGIVRDKDGLITTVTDASGTTTNVYYPSTWLKTTTVSAGTSKTLTYQYNGVGLVNTLTIPGGGYFEYGYNTRSLLTSVTNPDSVQVTFTYDDGGRRTRVTRPGSYIEYVYNARDWITAVRNRTTGGTVRYDALYYYNDGTLWDNTGNPLKRVENFGGSDFTTTLRYDDVYRETEETKRDSGGGVVYTHLYSYDEVGNRIGRNDGGTRTLYHGYDANNKLTMTRWVGGGGPPGPITANFYYDGAGNMTSVTGTEFGSKTLTYDDESRLSSIAYGSVTDTSTYNWQGLRTRAYLNGTWYRYLYNGERVLQELTNAGAVNATYTTENDSYYGALLHIQRTSGSLSRFPLYDEIGSARGLVDASGTVTDTYDMDTFGTARSSTGSTPNPYRYGAAWGYITDPSGFLQLGARYYWPEVGRFVSQDPARDEASLYAYARGNPVVLTDPTGLTSLVVLGGPGAIDEAAQAIACAKETAAELDNKYMGHKLNDHWLHCVYSCEITRRCGTFGGWAAAIGKEAKDALGEGECSWGDLVADKRGIENAAGKDSCEKSCDGDYSRKPEPKPKPNPPPTPAGQGRQGARPCPAV